MPSPALGSPVSGGHASRQSPVQLLLSGESWVNRYSVIPAASVTMSPTAELATVRSEERRVGKAGRNRGAGKRETTTTSECSGPRKLTQQHAEALSACRSN